MATIRSFTNVSQSKILVKILPLESADMGWNVFVDDTTRILPINDWDLVKDGSGSVKFYPAWSLAALLCVLPEIQGGKPTIDLDDNYITYPHMSDLHTKADNPVDACVALIIRLNELKML